jgi:hypothetical protein
MGNSDSKKSHPMDAYFDVQKYRRMKPNFTDDQIISIYELFKDQEPDDNGEVRVERVQKLFQKSCDKDQLRE